ncbi:MAG: hypothetical protein GXP08_17405 [Gammaproteobacteria bacterium]|nr:hypothetical protein [Gammaproteobacteria bacterium]
MEKTISSSLDSLFSAFSNSADAVETLSKDAKKLALESKRLTKKRSALMKRKKIAAGKLKKSPDAANRKALKDVEKEIAGVTKLLDKVKPQKAASTEELMALKACFKKASAYMKSIEGADKTLNKPKKKIRKKRAKPAAPAAEVVESM